MNSKRLILMGIAILITLTTAIPSAKADVIQNITNSNCGINCSLVPANTVLGTVTLSLVGGNIQVTMAINSGYTFILPDGNDIAINGAGALGSFSIDNNLVYMSTTGLPGSFTTPLTYNCGGAACNSGSGPLVGPVNIGSGLGTFAVVIQHVNGTQPTQYLQFTIVPTSGSFTAQDLNNISLALHLGQWPSPSGCATGAITSCTGFVPTSTIPEPASLALLGSGLFGLGYLRRRYARR